MVALSRATTSPVTVITVSTRSRSSTANLGFEGVTTHCVRP